MALHLTGDPAADDLLTGNPLALLIGMLLDQQVPMETAFAGPLKISQRIGAGAGEDDGAGRDDVATMDAATLAGYDPEALAALFAQTPAVHRFPGSMAGRVQALCRDIEADWGGDAAAIWTKGEPSGKEVLKRLKTLPGFGEQKAKIFVALLGKQCGFTGDGWRGASAPYGEEGSYRSVADIVSPESLALVRAHKKEMKAAARGAKASTDR